MWQILCCPQWSPLEQVDQHPPPPGSSVLAANGSHLDPPEKSAPGWQTLLIWEFMPILGAMTWNQQLTDTGVSQAQPLPLPLCTGRPPWCRLKRVQLRLCLVFSPDLFNSPPISSGFPCKQSISKITATEISVPKTVHRESDLRH